MSAASITPRGGVVALTGYGLRIGVEQGHLIIQDGVGTARRAGRFSRVGCGIERLIVLGHSGVVSLEALRWLHEIGAAFVQIGADGELIATGAPHALSDVRLRRNQAIAFGTDTGLRIARDLLEAKVAGQARVLDLLNCSLDIRDAVSRALGEISHARTLDRLRFVESRAAAAYWSTWEDVPVRFAGRDAKHVPEHWRTVGTRSSLLTASPRKATSPANALLNYLYAILEAESRLAALAVGCDPALGVIHTDKPSRDSLACDLMEPVRPSVDEHVLRLLQSHTFARSDFFETREGNCRLMPEVSRPLAASAPHWARAVAPIAERIGGAFRHGTAVALPAPGTVRSPGQRFRTPLTGTNYSTPKRSRVYADVATSLVHRCRSCGTGLGKRKVVYCDDCRPVAAREASAKGVQVRRELRTLNPGPRSSADTRAKQRRHATVRAKERQAWEASHDVVPSRATYQRDIAPILAHVPSNVLAEATGLSRQFCAKAKRGTMTPHARYWTILRDAATVYLNAHAADAAVLNDPTFFARTIEPRLRALGAAGIQQATGLSASYSRRVLAGHNVPDTKHWPALGRAVATISSRAK